MRKASLFRYLLFLAEWQLAIIEFELSVILCATLKYANVDPLSLGRRVRLGPGSRPDFVLSGPAGLPECVAPLEDDGRLASCLGA